MNLITNDNLTQSAVLTVDQKQLLSHFDALNDKFQEMMVGLCRNLAQKPDNCRARNERPRLRLVSGGAA